MIHRIAIHGAAGRMGQRLVALAADDPDWRWSPRWNRRGIRDWARTPGTMAGVGAAGRAARRPRLTAESTW